MRTIAPTTINRQQKASQRKLYAACVRKHAKKMKAKSHHYLYDASQTKYVPDTQYHTT